jgi:hypothetical protein
MPIKVKTMGVRLYAFFAKRKAQFECLLAQESLKRHAAEANERIKNAALLLESGRSIYFCLVRISS